jgi:hypothetical protein
VVIDLLVNLIASAILLGFGYLGGQYRERRLHQGKNLEEYEFYPFGLDDRAHLFFDLQKFCAGVRYLLRRTDRVAARQLVLVGQQNDVENSLSGEERAQYKKLYRRVGGDRILDDTAAYLENYERIVRLLGDSFPAPASRFCSTI